EDAADAVAAEPDRAGAPDAADAADDGVDLAPDDRLLRLERSRRTRPLLVHRELRKYHSAELRGRVGQPAAVAVQDCRGGSAGAAEQGIFQLHEQGGAKRRQVRAAGRLEQAEKAEKNQPQGVNELEIR